MWHIWHKPHNNLTHNKLTHVRYMSHLRKIQSKCQPKNYQNHRKTLYQNSKHTVPELKTIRTWTQNNKYQNSKQWVPERIVPWPDSCFGYNIAYTLTFDWQIPPLNSKCAMNLTSVKQLILSQLQRSCQIWHIFSPKHFFWRYSYSMFTVSLSPPRSVL